MWRQRWKVSWKGAARPLVELAAALALLPPAQRPAAVGRLRFLFSDPSRCVSVQPDGGSWKEGPLFHRPWTWKIPPYTREYNLNS